MVNWFLRATGEAGQPVTQVAAVSGVFVTYTASATGELYDHRDAPLIVNGHSLGGHLTTAFARLFPDNVLSSNTYNGAGFNPWSETTFQALESVLGFPQGTFPGPAEQNNYFAEHGINVTTNDWWFGQFGERISVFNEEGTGIPNHLMYKLTDSLGLAEVMGILDPNLTLETVSQIFNASSGSPETSLETTLTSLVTLFEENYRYGTPNYNAQMGQIDYRESYYTRLFALEDYIRSTAFYDAETGSCNLTVQSLSGRTAADLTNSAKTDLATRYALYKLNAFTVDGVGLYETINGDSALDLYDPTTRTGALTDEYLKDRAALLYYKILAGNEDREANDMPFVPYAMPQHFQDDTGPLAYHLYLGPNESVVDQSLQSMPNIVFGSWLSETLTGGDAWDKLYGMDGDDTLAGSGGDDYLEGGGVTILISTARATGTTSSSMSTVRVESSGTAKH